jgi:hypothetical protein
MKGIELIPWSLCKLHDICYLLDAAFYIALYLNALPQCIVIIVSTQACIYDFWLMHACDWSSNFFPMVVCKSYMLANIKYNSRL